MKRISLTAIAFLLASVTGSGQCWAQQSQTNADLQKQLDALKAQVTAMQKDLDEIKDLLAPLRGQQGPKPEDIKLNLGTRPVKGNPSAKLILIEFTDYQ